MPDHKPTPLQDAIFRAMIDHRRKHGCWPTLDEIGEAIDRSAITVWEAMQGLTKRGIVVKGATGTARCYSVAPEHMPRMETVVLPVEGRIYARSAS
jgi:hypothetical protein